MIAYLEQIYPEDETVSMGNPITAYHLGTLAGLKAAVGDYPSFLEMDWEAFCKNNFEQALT